MKIVGKTGTAWLVACLCALAFGMAVACSDDDDGGTAGITIIEYDEVVAMMGEGEAVFIDVRPKTDYDAGHLQDAINVDMGDVIEGTGSLVDGGKALTDAVPDIATPVVFYCFGYGNDKDMSEAAVELGYTHVYRYAGGTLDWTKHETYLVIEYPAFKAWHEARFPFDDGENYLIDDLPEPWYTGDDPQHPGGHIPGAINVPVGLFADGEGNPIDDGKALTGLAPNKDAFLVIYCGNMQCGKSLMGVMAAVKLGYTNVYRFESGQQAWMEAGNDLKPGLEP